MSSVQQRMNKPVLSCQPYASSKYVILKIRITSASFIFNYVIFSASLTRPQTTTQRVTACDNLDINPMLSYCAVAKICFKINSSSLISHNMSLLFKSIQTKKQFSIKAEIFFFSLQQYYLKK